VVLLQDDPELNGSEGLLTLRSRELRSRRLRTPERMPVMKTILNCCRWGLPLSARASISYGTMRTLSCLGEQGNGRQGLDFHD
jgi:hypothetical protein